MINTIKQVLSLLSIMKLRTLLAVYVASYMLQRKCSLRKSSLCLLVFFSSLTLFSGEALSAASEADIPELRVGVSGRPIFQYVDENEQFAGLDVELSKLIFEEAGFRIRFIYYPWTRILYLVKLGELDVALSAADSEERMKYAYFSTEALRLGHNVFLYQSYKPG